MTTARAYIEAVASTHPSGPLHPIGSRVSQSDGAYRRSYRRPDGSEIVIVAYREPDGSWDWDVE